MQTKEVESSANFILSPSTSKVWSSNNRPDYEFCAGQGSPYSLVQIFSRWLVSYKQGYEDYMTGLVQTFWEYIQDSDLCPFLLLVGPCQFFDFGSLNNTVSSSIAYNGGYFLQLPLQLTVLSRCCNCRIIECAFLFSISKFFKIFRTQEILIWSDCIKMFHLIFY